MSEERDFTAADLARQARQHLDSLRAAGVEWLPSGPAPAPRLAGAAPAGNAPSLFPELQEQAPAALPPAATSVEARTVELKLLAERVAPCTRCAGLASTRTQTVFGVGQIDPELCFIGEAPGREEDAAGEPFVGEAGRLLNRIIAACGFKREEVYILNIIKCRPPGNRTPLPEEAANCREYLERQLELVRPKFICCLGGTAATNLLGTTLSLGKLRGKVHDYRGIPVMCTYHPAFLLRDPRQKKEAWKDLQMVMKELGLKAPS